MLFFFILYEFQATAGMIITLNTSGLKNVIFLYFVWISGNNWNDYYFKGHREVLNLSSDPEVFPLIVLSWF